jgi:hypothetical protein
MSDYLSADELADLVDCKPNQRVKMAAWLDANRWEYVVGSSGLPKVARAYRDRKMGISEGKAQSKYAETPNLQAFAQRALARG